MKVINFGNWKVKKGDGISYPFCPVPTKLIIEFDLILREYRSENGCVLPLNTFLNAAFHHFIVKKKDKKIFTLSKNKAHYYRLLDKKQRLREIKLFKKFGDFLPKRNEDFVFLISKLVYGGIILHEKNKLAEIFC